jgi:hypothetical protein
MRVVEVKEKLSDSGEYILGGFRDRFSCLLSDL